MNNKLMKKKTITHFKLYPSQFCLQAFSKQPYSVDGAAMAQNEQTEMGPLGPGRRILALVQLGEEAVGVPSGYVESGGGGADLVEATVELVG